MTERKTPRMAFFVSEAFMTANGIVPACVTEGEPGYGLMLGNGRFSQPWYWGMDIATAKEVCAKANTDLGLTPKDVDEIVTSSMRAQGEEEQLREQFEERWERIKKGRP
jgi:hypothetical protein